MLGALTAAAASAAPPRNLRRVVALDASDFSLGIGKASLVLAPGLSCRDWVTAAGLCYSGGGIASLDRLRSFDKSRPVRRKENGHFCRCLAVRLATAAPAIWPARAVSARPFR